MQISTKALEARINSAEARLENLKAQVLASRNAEASFGKIDIEHEIAAVYSLLIDLAKEVLAIQKEWNRGNY